ncbi:hypothetical protein DFR50_12476 [Roseiarcus fermentans]|uniref:Uncharacterized protein n=1 Tax=Roseiarcus fermentans TaxID=1473586 RepID=A0A366F4J7_9HYPH|nr:hypothetical protein [Roseiarcus fermentans]RBP08689.1 hypothetical protein DFR50_12476 [Roseiarcus fermentans]
MSRVFALIGTPSPVLYATMNMVRALIQVAFGDHDVFCANTAVELEARLADLSRAGDRCAMAYSDYPQREVLAAYGALSAPLVICADDFLTVAHYSVVSREYGGVDAARFASMALVNIEPVISAPPALSLLVNDPSIRLRDLAARLADLYQLPFDDAALRVVRRVLGQAEDGDESLNDYAATCLTDFRPARAMLEDRSPLENELLDVLAGSYAPIAQGRSLEALEWPPFALLRPDFPDRLTVGPIDLTGPARFIHYGPYFALPEGRWLADLVIEVSECLSDNQIAIDVVSGTILTARKMKLPPQGVYSCEIPFEITVPANPVELRLQLLTGAIEGQLMLRGIHLRRVVPADSGGAEFSRPTRSSGADSRTAA